MKKEKYENDFSGASIVMQIRELRRVVQILVATPGKLIDLIERKAIL